MGHQIRIDRTQIEITIKIEVNRKAEQDIEYEEIWIKDVQGDNDKEKGENSYLRRKERQRR